LLLPLLALAWVAIWRGRLLLGHAARYSRVTQRARGRVHARGLVWPWRHSMLSLACVLRGCRRSTRPSSVVLLYRVLPKEARLGLRGALRVLVGRLRPAYARACRGLPLHGSRRGGTSDGSRRHRAA